MAVEETGSYRRGFEDCLELVEDIVSSKTDLQGIKDDLKVVRASVSEKRVEVIREDLGL